MAKLTGAKKAAFLARMAKGRAKKAGNSSKSAKSATNNNKRGTTQTMQKTVRRTRRQRAAGGIRRARAGTSKVISTVKPYISGIGGGVAVEAGVNKVAPQYGQIAGYAGAYGFGGVKGVVGKVIFDLATGRGLPSIPNFGSNQSSGGGFTL